MLFLKNFSVFFLCILAMCGTVEAQVENFPQPSQKGKPELYLKMQRTNCFGRCQVYNLEIYPDGKAIFEGIQFTKIIGKVRSNLSKEKMHQLTAEINKTEFFDLKDSYNIRHSCPVIVNHNPTIILSIKLNEKEKTISHYLGCRENYKIGEPWKVFPQQLYDLENKIDEIVEIERWIGERK